MAMTIDDAAGILKQRYPARKVEYIGYKDNPLLALVPKDPTFVGSVYDLPLHFGGNQGGSHTFAKAQANKTGGLYGSFLLTRKADYALTSVPTEAVLATMDDIGAFLRLSTTEIDNTIRQSSNNLNKELFGNHGGARGQVGSVSTTVLTLKDINDVTKFEVGMTLVDSATDGTSGSANTEAIPITAIDYQAGKLTAAVTWTAGGHFANDNYLFREGDFGNAISGMGDWLPSSAPSATLFFNQDRSKSSRIGGLRYDGSSEGSIAEALEEGDVRASREGARLSHCFVSFADFSNLRKSLGSKVIYDKVSSPDMASISFRSIVLTGMKGDVQVVADKHCPKGVAYMLDMSTWVLASLGPCPRFLAAMGQNETIWDYNADSVEFRAGHYAQLGCRAPGYNIRVALPTG